MRISHCGVGRWQLCRTPADKEIIVAPLKPCHADPDSTRQICCADMASQLSRDCQENSFLLAADNNAAAGESSRPEYRRARVGALSVNVQSTTVARIQVHSRQPVASGRIPLIPTFTNCRPVDYARGWSYRRFARRLVVRTKYSSDGFYSRLVDWLHVRPEPITKECRQSSVALLAHSTASIVGTFS